jgi:hypothetical protein
LLSEFDLDGGGRRGEFQSELSVWQDGAEELELLPGPLGGLEPEAVMEAVAEEEQDRIGGQQWVIGKVIAAEAGGWRDVDLVEVEVSRLRDGGEWKSEFGHINGGKQGGEWVFDSGIQRIGRERILGVDGQAKDSQPLKLHAMTWNSRRNGQ